jgi:hypothetical protein
MKKVLENDTNVIRIGKVTIDDYGFNNIIFVPNLKSIYSIFFKY